MPQNSTTGVVKVRFWLPTQKRVGHVSLEIDDGIDDSMDENQKTYVSFWPDVDNDPNNNLSKYIVKQFDGGGYLRTYDYDKIIQQEIPTIEYELHTLDVERIKAAFENFKATFQGSWGFLGYPTNKDPETYNCCSLVLYLLRKGGIEEFSETINDTCFTKKLVFSGSLSLFSWCSSVYFESEKVATYIVLVPLLGNLFNWLENTADNSLIGLLSSSSFAYAGCTVGSLFGGLGGAVFSYLLMLARIQEKKLDLDLAIQYLSIFFDKTSVVILGGTGLSLLAILTSVVTMAGASSGRIIKYGTSLWYFRDNVHLVIKHITSNSILHKSIDVALFFTLGRRMLYLGGRKHTVIFDSIIDANLIYHLIKTHYSQSSVAADWLGFLMEEFQTRDREVVNCITSIIGFSNYKKNITFGMLAGGFFLGAISYFFSFIGFNNMNKVSLKIKEILNSITPTPGEIEMIVSNAKKNEERSNDNKSSFGFFKHYRNMRLPFFNIISNHLLASVGIFSQRLTNEKVAQEELTNDVESIKEDINLVPDLESSDDIDLNYQKQAPQ